MNENLKQSLQNQWQNTWFNAKMYFKSHDLAQIIQFTLLFLPPTFGILSLAYWWIKILDTLALIFSIFALVYFINYWKNQESFMEWGEKYLDIYHEIETYYKSSEKYDSKVIKNFNDKISELNKEKRPEYHIFAKVRVDKKMDKEMTYWNEKKPWYK